MALKESKSMAEVRECRRRLFAKAKGKIIGEKMVWISKHAKILGKPAAIL